MFLLFCSSLHFYGIIITENHVFIWNQCVFVFRQALSTATPNISPVQLITQPTHTQQQPAPNSAPGGLLMIQQSPQVKKEHFYLRLTLCRRFVL